MSWSHRPPSGGKEARRRHEFESSSRNLQEPTGFTAHCSPRMTPAHGRQIADARIISLITGNMSKRSTQEARPSWGTP